jgi:hypothetical protein
MRAVGSGPILRNEPKMSCSNAWTHSHSDGSRARAVQCWMTANDLAIRRALEAAGIEFIDENDGGPGVQLRKRQRAKQPK